MPPDRPNVLFVFGDQHRGDAMGCAGDPNVATPNMDRLADEGTRYAHAYATDPVCGPNRACLLSGQYPLSNRVLFNGMPLPADAPSVGAAFRDAGYRTGYIGKWHLDRVPYDEWIPPGPRRHGFDDFWAVNHSAHDYLDAEYYRGDDPDPATGEGYTPAVEADLATEFAGADDDRPFCLFLSWGPPHAPYGQLPEEYRGRYDPEELRLRENVEPLAGDSPMDGNPIRETIADSYAQISAVDEQLGRLLDFLDEAGLAEDTVVVYTADHGDMLWSQGQWGKGYPWEESIHVPFLVRWPGEVPAGETSDALLSTVDVAPTLLGLAGETPPGEMEGRDCSATLRGETDPDRDSVFITRTCTASLQTTDRKAWRGLPKPEWRGVRTRRHTFARLQDGSDWLLYDNEADPYQHRNFVEDPDHRSLQAELGTRLDGWLDRLGDDFLTGAEHARNLGVVEDLNRTLEWHGVETV